MYSEQLFYVHNLYNKIKIILYAPKTKKRRSSPSGTSLTPHERGQTETGIDAPEIAIRLRGKDVPNPQKTSVVQVQTLVARRNRKENVRREEHDAH
jgi:hypothetical protein